MGHGYLSCWFAAFSFALTVLFLLLTSFIVCQAILDCLSSTETLILSIWFCMYSVCSFIYIPANWYCAVFSFRAFVFVGFFDSFWRLFFSDVLLWTPTYDLAKVGRPARTYIQLLCEDTGCSPEDRPEAMNDREKWWERVRNIRASGTTRWWWWWYN